MKIIMFIKVMMVVFFVMISVLILNVVKFVKIINEEVENGWVLVKVVYEQEGIFLILEYCFEFRYNDKG